MMCDGGDRHRSRHVWTSEDSSVELILLPYLCDFGCRIQTTMLSQLGPGITEPSHWPS